MGLWYKNALILVMVYATWSHIRASLNNHITTQIIIRACYQAITNTLRYEHTNPHSNAVDTAHHISARVTALLSELLCRLIGFNHTPALLPNRFNHTSICLAT